MRTIAIIAAMAVWSSAVATADAQSADARALIDRGLDAREAGDDVAAHTLIQQAYDLEPSPQASAQLGLVEQALGLWVNAERHLGEALDAPRDAWVRRHRRALQQSLEVVRGNLGSLEVIGNVPGAAISIGGTVIGTLPLAEPLRLPAGRVNVEVTADGYRPQNFSIDVSPGGLSRQLVDLAVQPVVEDEPEPEPVDQSPPPPSRGTSFVLTGVAAGVTVAALATTIGLAVHTQSIYDGLRTECGPICSVDHVGSTGLPDFQAATNGLLVTTLVLAAAATTVLVLEVTGALSVEVAAGPTRIQLAGNF